jgi:hypothetical protein
MIGLDQASVVEIVLSVSFGLAFLGFGVLLFGVLRYLDIKGTKKNTMLAFLLGPLSIGFLEVDVEKKASLIRCLRVGFIVLFIALCFTVLGLYLAFWA